MQTQRVRSGTRTVWSIDPAHSIVEFTVKNFMFFTVKGSFRDIGGILRREGDDIARSTVEVTIKAASIATGIKRRDAHLRSKDFLNTDLYPDIRFQSTTVERGGDRDTLRVTGLLTIKQTSREVVLDVNEMDWSRSPNGEEVVYYTATTELDRFDLGVNYLPGVIGRKLQIAINVQASRRIDSGHAAVG